MAIASEGPETRLGNEAKKQKRDTAMNTNASSFGARFVFAIFLSAVIAGGYLTAIGYLTPGFFA
jgi:hypothetical protein